MGSQLSILGDLNAKTATVGYKGLNKNGEVLEEVLSLAEYNLFVFNNESPTYFKFKSSYTEMLDLFLSSTTHMANKIFMANKISHFEVLTDHKMESDHASIFCTLNFDKAFKIFQRETKQRNPFCFFLTFIAVYFAFVSIYFSLDK